MIILQSRNRSKSCEQMQPTLQHLWHNAGSRNNRYCCRTTVWFVISRASKHLEKKKSTEGFDWTTMFSVISCSLFFAICNFLFVCLSFSKVSHQCSQSSGPFRIACLCRAPGRSARRPRSSSPPGWRTGWRAAARTWRGEMKKQKEVEEELEEE